jgi:hypothetical protein
VAFAFSFVLLSDSFTFDFFGFNNADDETDADADRFKVVSLIQTGGAGNDKLLRHAMGKIGWFYADRRQWEKAVHYFTQAKVLVFVCVLFYSA